MADRHTRFPIAIIQDRYSGSYSGGAWLAIAGADEIDGIWKPRVIDMLEGGPHGDDTDAMMFWADPPSWIAVGNSPDEALANLEAEGG
ncbi:MAG: hypothetical protein ACR2QH_01645 [Geminicoccaceae bacterium]